MDIIQKSGFLLINKPKEWTSHDVVGYLRGMTKIKKIGHAGTLDPFATGLLIVGVGRESTKRLDEFKGMRKRYLATVKLGATSDTQDCTGVISEQVVKSASVQVLEAEVVKVINGFVGKQLQTPPMYSAKKVDGKKLYDLARKGIVIERVPNEIEIYDIKLLDYSWPILKTEVECSTGTYIRTLANDIGEKLGVGGYCDELERIMIGEHGVGDAVGPKDLNKDNWENKLIRNI